MAFLDLNNTIEANDFFRISYHGFISSPFNVWCEKNLNLAGDCGQSNYLIGAGAFLQLLLIGYAGIHLHLDYLLIKKPTVLLELSEYEINGLTYLGAKYNIVVTNKKAWVVFKGVLTETPLFIEQNGTSVKLKSYKKCMECIRDSNNKGLAPFFIHFQMKYQRMVS